MEQVNEIVGASTSSAQEAVIEYLAAFYTPPDVAQFMTDWAIVDEDCTVLDPSYGGCSFLNASLATLQERGSPCPGTQIYGVDIDAHATSYLQELFAAGASAEQFVCRDFFELEPSDLAGFPFGAVTGNFPYIRYHDIPEEFRRRAGARLRQYGIEISGRASYWAFFLLYSIKFLKPGGRLAIVLPGSFIHTDYSVQIRELLTSQFERVNIILLQERIFKGTQEESVIVCAEGAGRPNLSLRIGTASTVEELRDVLGDIDNRTRSLGSEVDDKEWLGALIEEAALELYGQLTGGSNVVKLGDVLVARIGVVTGNNNYFIPPPQTLAQKGLPTSDLIPVIRRPLYFKGVMVTDEDLDFLRASEKAHLLLSPPRDKSAMKEATRSYIDEGERAGINTAKKCKARKPWYVVPHTEPPAAFMPCMVASWPRLVVNDSGFTCTNNILKLTWKEDRPNSDWTRLALGTLSTVSQLSAELVGRSYGGGVLKVEPTELKRLAVPLLSAETAHRVAGQVDGLLRENKVNEASDVVDAALVAETSGLTPSGLAQLRNARNQLFLRRRKHRRDAERIVGL